MTYPISDVTRRVVYSGSAGVGPYSFSFEVLDEGDIAVYENDTLLTITTDYTVTINADGTGSVTLVTASTSSDTVAILGNKGIERQTDFVTGGDLFASSLNDELDAQTIFAQQNAEAASRAIKIPPQSSLSIDTTLPVPEGGYILGWNDDGDAILNLQEIGSYQGTDATTTTVAYKNRDLIKSTTAAQLNNVYICTAASVAGDLLTDTDHFALIIDAVSAATSAANAATSESNAATSESNASTSESNAADSASDAEKLAINPEDSQFTLSDGTTTGYSALHHKEKALDAQSAAETAQAAAEAAQSAAEAVLDNFDDAYLGAKASDPTLDNDGDALDDGALYFDTTNNVMKVYDLGSTTWYQLTPTVANQTNINTVAGISSDVSDVAAVDSDVTTVAGIDTDVTAVAGVATEVGLLGTADAVADMNTLGTAAIVADMDTLADIAADITTLAHIEDGTDATNAIQTVATNVSDVTNFADVYIGASATAPTTRADGSSALEIGDLYFDTASDTMKVYSSGGWVSTGSSVNGTADRFVYTVSSSTTTITGADDSGSTLAYDAGYVDVYLNGVKMVTGTDITATSGTSIVFDSAIGASGTDTVDIIAYGTFALSNFSINDANDVATTGVTNGQVLAYNSTSGDFEPTTVDLTSLSASNLTSGTIPDARFPATLPAVDGSNLTNIETFTKSASDPAYNTNGTLGDVWVNTTSGEVFVLTDATTDLNVWTNVGDGSGNIVPDYSIDYLVVAGGAAGGSSGTATGIPAGGGAGGYQSVTSFTVSPGTAYSATVGAGGAGTPGGTAALGASGSNSSFSTTTSLGGGGGSPGRDTNINGASGGSGGGGGGGGGGTGTGAGSGTSGQGNAGGTGSASASAYGGGGGGGASAVGGNGSSSAGGTGGAGTAWLNGTTYAGGGGGGVYLTNGTPGSGGAGGGGAGSDAGNDGTSGTANTGGGGGGAGEAQGGGGSGGSGIVIIRYSGAQRGTGGTVTSSGGYTYHTFTSSGTYTA